MDVKNIDKDVLTTFVSDVLDDPHLFLNYLKSLHKDIPFARICASAECPLVKYLEKELANLLEMDVSSFGIPIKVSHVYISFHNDYSRRIYHVDVPYWATCFVERIDSYKKQENPTLNKPKSIQITPAPCIKVLKQIIEEIESR